MPYQKGSSTREGSCVGCIIRKQKGCGGCVYKVPQPAKDFAQFILDLTIPEGYKFEWSGQGFQLIRETDGKCVVHTVSKRKLINAINELVEKEKWSCYDCTWASDKCKNTDSDQYNKFLKDIEECKLTGKCDNTLGRSWRNLGKD